jgi:hypothetical protein
MNLGLLIPVLGLAPLCLIALWQLPKMWRFNADIQRTEATKQWWPLGEALRHGFVRGMPVGILAGTALTVSMALVLVEESTSGGTQRAAAEAAWIAFLVFVGLVLVDLSVTLFNWPKVVVPPAARDEPGALALWWRGVRYRHSRRPRQRMKN